MTAEIMTVLGPIPANEMGITLPHEHLLSDLYRVSGDPDHLLNDVLLAIKEVSRFREAGGSTLIDVTSRGLGRRPDVLRRIALETGLHIVMGCGWYRESYFDQEVYEKSANQIADDIVQDITQGIDGTNIRPGIIGEVGCDRDYISPVEERAFRAAARAHKRTGLTIITHSARCGVGLDQLDLLEEESVDLGRVIVSHCDTYPNPDYHEAVARRGAFVEFDTVRGNCEWETEQRVHWVTLLMDKGYQRQILLSHDVCMRSHLRAYGGNGYDYLLTGFVPRLLEGGLSQEDANILLIGNPRAALTGELT